MDRLAAWVPEDGDLGTEPAGVLRCPPHVHRCGARVLRRRWLRGL